MLTDLSKQKLELDYPCDWLYKVISSDHEAEEQRIRTLLQEFQCSIMVSNRSRSGKYTSLDVTVQVQSEEHRQTVYGLLRESATVKMVL